MNPTQSKSNNTHSHESHHGGHARDHEVSHLRGRPADPAVAPLPPDADVLVLIGEVLAAGKVVGLDGADVGAEVVLLAAVRGQIVVVAGVLGDL